MSVVDDRGCTISGAQPAALQSYERALAAFQGWRCGADMHLERALQEAPSFVMAHVMQAYLFLCSRDPRRVQSARPVLSRAAGLPANDCEQLHLAAIDAVLADDYDRAKARLGDVLRRQPLDALALQVAHAFDHSTGDADSMSERVVSVLPAWSSDLPGYHAVLSMHAFALGECGEYERAEEVARAALALNPFDARAHHVMAHVLEMSERPGAGLRWMSDHMAAWDGDTLVATHCWWHMALFHLDRGHVDAALSLYDKRVRAGGSADIADLIDAAALLWRIHLRGRATGARWAGLADAWARHIDDGFCSFNDVHAMLAFVGAGDWDRARRLELALVAAQSLPTRHGQSSRQLGLPACRALIAFGRGSDALAVSLLGSLSPQAAGFGGSHAQRDVLHLTLLRAIERIRRPARRPHRVGSDPAIARVVSEHPERVNRVQQVGTGATQRVATE